MMLTPLVFRYRLGGYCEFDVPPLLAPFCEALWTYRAPWDAALPAGTMHRVLPDPAVSLAFGCFRAPGGEPVESSLLLIGPKTRPAWVTYPRGYEMAAVRMKLEWTAPL